MLGRVKASLVAVGVLLGAMLTGCGANPYGYGADGLYYGQDGYGSGYDSGYGSGYDSGYDSSYGGGYDSGYGSGYDTGYDSSYDSGYDTGYSGGYGTPTPSPSAKPTAAPASTLDRPVLSAWVIDVKESGVLGLGNVTAKVEVENPSDRTLSGKLEVRFTDDGNLTPNKQTRRVTLRPFEKQVLSFTAKGWRLDDAEAVIETEDAAAPTADGTGSVVRDRS